MSIKTSDTWRAPSRGTPEQALATFKAWGSFPMGDVEDFVREVYRLCGLVGMDASMLVAHAALETGSPSSGKGFLYSNWASVDAYRSEDNRYNPSGLGITDGGDFGYGFAGGTEAARGHVVHHAVYEILASDVAAWTVLKPYIDLDPRYDAVPKANRGTVKTLADLQGKWWTTKGGDANLASRGNQIYPNLPDQGTPSTTTTKPPTSSTGGSPVVTSPPIEQAYTAWNVPGCKRPLLLPSWIKVVIRPVDLARVRSYEKWAKSMTTVHDTGNPRTNAQAEYEWLAAGRPGGEVGGYEWISDDTIVIWTGWVDETTWAQGVLNGNRISHAGEIAFGANANFTNALEIACAVHGGILEMDDITDEDADVLHQFWYGKYCAQEILNRGLWPQTHAKIQSYRRAAATFRAGQPVIEVPGTVYAAKSIPMVDGKPWDGLADVTVNGVKFEAQKTTAKTTSALNQRQWASTESLTTGPVIPAGTSVDLLGWVAGELVDGISEWWVRADGARLWAGGIDVEPKVDPDYGQEPEPPTGDVELPAHGPVPVNGRLYYPLFDEERAEAGTPALGRKITVERAGNLYKWADTTTPVVGTVTPAEEGQPPVEHVFKYWTRGEELPLTMKNAAGETVTVGEPIWYAEDLYTGARMWSGLSTERPD